VARITNRVRPIDEHRSSIRAVRIVATRAFLLFVGRVSSRQLLPRLLDVLMARKTQLATDRIEELGIPSCVRSVAGKATCVALDRLVHVFYPCIRVLVTREAELVTRCDEQVLRFRGMRIVAVQACTIFEWLVLHITGHEQIFRGVAIRAEVRVLRRDLEGILVRWRIVASLAVSAENRFVHARLEQGGQIR